MSTRPGWSALRARLNAVIGLGLVLVLAMAGVGVGAIVHLVDVRHDLIVEIDPASLAAGQLLLAYVDQETGVRGYILSGDSSFLQPTEAGIEEQYTAQRHLDTALRALPSLLAAAHTAEARAQHWQTTWAQPAIKATAVGNRQYASQLALAYGKALLDHARAAFSTLDGKLETARTQDSGSLTAATVELAVVGAVGIALALIGMVALRETLRRWVLVPLERLGRDAQQVTQGDLAHPVTAAGPAEIAQLGTDIEAMRERIVFELREVEQGRRDLDARNEELRRSNQELEQFAYVASHDLQEPIRKVVSFTQLLQQRYGEQLDERADQYIAFAVDGAERMQRLIADLLAFSRVGRSEEGFGLVSMHECVTAALNNLSEVVRAADARVTVADLPEVWGDEALLTSVWQNLIGNALKFRAEEPPAIRIEAQSEPGRWLFSIADNGIGIDERFAEKIFVIFQRLHGRDAYAGTGIGLALCRKVIEFHGGSIWLDTQVQEGTRISFSLPAANRRARAEPVTSTPTSTTMEAE